MKKVSPVVAAAAWFKRSPHDIYQIDRRHGVCAVRVDHSLCMLESGHPGRHQPRAHMDDRGREWAERL